MKRATHTTKALARLLYAYERGEIDRGLLVRLWRAVLLEGYGWA